MMMSSLSFSKQNKAIYNPNQSEYKREKKKKWQNQGLLLSETSLLSLELLDSVIAEF